MCLLVCHGVIDSTVPAIPKVCSEFRTNHTIQTMLVACQTSPITLSGIGTACVQYTTKPTQCNRPRRNYCTHCPRRGPTVFHSCTKLFRTANKKNKIQHILAKKEKIK